MRRQGVLPSLGGQGRGGGIAEKTKGGKAEGERRYGRSIFYRNISMNNGHILSRSISI